ncbi:hypothetical protein [Lactiplantibacillus plajomi]|uniref:hypothetical protein n=2 Tax=Lactiplantibacillus plajomi TaxID=1457217 RepID=UPI0039ECBD78
MDGQIQLKDHDRKIQRVYFDVMQEPSNDDLVTKSLLSSPVDANSRDNFKPPFFSLDSQYSVDIGNNGNGSEKTVNVKINPKTDFPIYVGFRIILNENDPEGYTYQMWKFERPGLPQPTLDPVHTVDTSLKGTGTAGNSVTATVNGETQTATVAADGRYQLTFAQPISTNNQTVLVTEMENSNADVFTGEHASVTGEVLALPTVSPTTATIEYTADDLNNLEGKSQQEVVNWIAQKANLKATGADNLVFMTESVDALQILKVAQKTGSTQFKIYAQTKEGQKSSAATVIAKYAGGILAFGAVPEQVDFGTFELPRLQSQKHWLANSSQLVVRDTRTGAKHWQLSAKLIKSAVNGQSFKGQLCYQDAEHPLSDAASLIKAGQGIGDEIVRLDGAQGLYLNVQPHNLAGTYAGEIEWTLQDVPGQNGG